MKKAQLLLLLTLTFCTCLIAEGQEVVAGSTVAVVNETASTVPESTFAILLGGILWFVLLRRRA